MKKLITLFLFAFLSFQNFTAQVDTSFWFATPIVTPDATNRNPYRLNIYTYGALSTTIRVRQPAAIAPNKYDTTFVLGPYTAFSYTFWRDAVTSLTNAAYDSLEVKPSDAVLPYGLYISSNNDISAVFDVVTNFNNPETFSLKGLTNGAGLDFYCPFQQKGNNITLSNAANTPPGIVQPKQQINIVATKANTTVSITPKCSVIGHPANVTYTILLPNPGSAYTVENASQTTTIVANNLSGTHVFSDKPISVTLADDCVRASFGGCYDLIGDQIVPVNVVGTEYVIVKGIMTGVEYEGVYVVATNNNTQITVDDGVITTTVINAGDTYFYKTNQSVTSLISTKNVYAMHLTGVGCEMSSDIVPPLACAGSSLTHFTRNNGQQLNINLYCKSGLQNNFTLNNSSSSVTVAITAADFTVVPGTSALIGGPYYGAKLALNAASVVPIGSYTVANNLGDFGLSICNGGGASGSYYHYTTLFSKAFNVTAGSNYSICANTSAVSLSGTISGITNTGTWTTANGTGSFGVYTSTVNTITTSYNLSAADQLLSSIKFYLTSTGGCSPKKDSIIVQLIPNPQLLTVNASTLCANTNSIALTGTITNAISGSWTGGTGFFPPGPNITYSPTAADKSAGTLTLTLTSIGGCSSVSQSITFTFVPLPTVTANTSNSLICVGQNATLTASGANTYSWNTSSTNTSIVVSPIVTTGYYVTGVTNGCSKTVTLTVSVSPCTGIDGATISNDFLKIYPNPNNGEFTVSSTTDIKLTLVNELGQLVKSITLNTSNDRSVSVTHLANGIYFITGTLNDKSINQKIVVTK